MHIHLPSNFTVRSPREEDIAEIIELIYASEQAITGSANRYTADDIRIDWGLLQPETDGWCIVSPEGVLAAYGLLWSHEVATYGRLVCDGYVHPLYRGQGLGATLLDLMEVRAGEIVARQPEDMQQVLVNQVVASDVSACALLETRGYTLARVFFSMEIALNETPPTPVWPEEIQVRICDGSEEDIYRCYVITEKAFRDHYDYHPRTFEVWRQSMVREDFDPGLWLLAIEDNEIAGVILGYVHDHEAALGEIPRLAVLPRWRKRGLGSALLRQAFVAFYQRGIRRVGLSVDSQSLTGAQRLYERAGMHVTMHIGRYTKVLQAGGELEPPVL